MINLKRKNDNKRLKNTKIIQGFIWALTLSLLPFGRPSIAQPIPAVERSLLQLGSQGETVLELQAVLMLMGYYTGEVDGNYAENTAEAVKQFQEEAGLNPDGIAGEDTWNSLFPPMELSSQGSVVVPEITKINATEATPLNVQNNVQNNNE